VQLFVDSSDTYDPNEVGATDENGSPSAPRQLSPSSAATFDQCPRRWRFRYVERLPDPPGREALVGTFAHRVLELLMQQHPGRRSKDDARRLARQAWPEMAESYEYLELGLDEDAAFDFRWAAWTAVEGLWDLEEPSDVEVISTEQHVSATLDGVPFRGVVDRVESDSDGLVISDYKSGRAPSLRYAASRLQQVLLYAAAIAEEVGEQPVRAQLLYLGQKVVSTEVDSGELDGAVGQFKVTWEAIGESCSNDDFEVRPGPLCCYCAYSQRCPEGQAEISRREELRAAEEQSLLQMAG